MSFDSESMTSDLGDQPEYRGALSLDTDETLLTGLCLLCGSVGGSRPTPAA